MGWRFAGPSSDYQNRFFDSIQIDLARLHTVGGVLTTDALRLTRPLTGIPVRRLSARGAVVMLFGIVLCWGQVVVGVAYAAPSAAGAPAASVEDESALSTQVALSARVSSLRKELQIATNDRQTAPDDAQYFMNVVLIIVGIATLVIAVVAIGSTVLGYRMVRSYVQAEFSSRADAAFNEHGRPLLDKAIEETYRRVEAKLSETDETLAEQLDQFRLAADGN